MITLPEQIIASRQTFKVHSVFITFGHENFAEVKYEVFNENNERINTITLLYSEEEYNEWWSNFTNGTFLYRELNRKRDLNVEVEDSEDEFLNDVHGYPHW